MKRAFALELLVLFSAGMSGIVIWNVEKWYFSLPAGFILLCCCSYLIGILKEETLREYMEKLKKQEEVLEG